MSGTFLELVLDLESVFERWRDVGMLSLLLGGGALEDGLLSEAFKGWHSLGSCPLRGGLSSCPLQFKIGLFSAIEVATGEACEGQ